MLQSVSNQAKTRYPEVSLLKQFYNELSTKDKVRILAYSCIPVLSLILGFIIGSYFDNYLGPPLASILLSTAMIKVIYYNDKSFKSRIDEILKTIDRNRENRLKMMKEYDRRILAKDMSNHLEIGGKPQYRLGAREYFSKKIPTRGKNRVSSRRTRRLPIKPKVTAVIQLEGTVNLAKIEKDLSIMDCEFLTRTKDLEDRSRTDINIKFEGRTGEWRSEKSQVQTATGKDMPTRARGKKISQKRAKLRVINKATNSDVQLGKGTEDPEDEIRFERLLSD